MAVKCILPIGVVVEFSPTAYMVMEGMNEDVMVVLRGEAAIAVSVQFSTQDGTAQGKPICLL